MTPKALICIIQYQNLHILTNSLKRLPEEMAQQYKMLLRSAAQYLHSR